MNLRLVITLLKWPVLQKKWIQHVWFIMKVILRQRSRMSILQCIRGWNTQLEITDEYDY